MTTIHMEADILQRPSHGLDPERSINPPLKRERQRHILEEAMRLKLPLPLLLGPDDVEGQAVLVYGQEDEIVMDACTPIAVLADLTEAERTGDWIMRTRDAAWTGLRFRVTGGNGCGKGYLGLGWSRDELTEHLLRTYTNLDFICLGADVSMNAMREERRTARERTSP